MTNRLHHARRIVVKIGSATLVDSDSGQLRRAWLDAIADDIAEFRLRGQEVLIVSSGAVALGRRQLGLAKKQKLEEKQAAAAVGQIRLAHAYQEALARHDITVAQILLTLGNTESRRHYLNARETLNTLLRLGAMPVINENDTVATAEIRFGDNDRLAARVAEMVGADALVLLSDIDGLYTADPRGNPDAKFIPEIAGITSAVEAMAGGAGTKVGSGGMVTKIAAARIASRAGCAMAICLGDPLHPLRRLYDGGRASWFLPEISARTARKQWIAGALDPRGTLVVDDGAARALAQGKSLLPAGVAAVEGEFERGDAVLVKNGAGEILARGLIAYGAEDALRIAGHKSHEIEAILGYRGREEMIHRDDLVVG